MTAYVLGAGASRHAGYPLAGDLWNQLYDWVRENKPDGDWCRASIEQLNQLYGGPTNFGKINFEEILTELDDCPPSSRAATLEGTHRGSVRANAQRSILDCFDGIRQRPALLYDQFARERVQTDDIIITFNYDLACERALNTAGKWEISDGYGFLSGINAVLPSSTKILKLHGSTDWWWPQLGGRMPGRWPRQISGDDFLPATPVIRSREDVEFLGYPAEIFGPSRASAPSGAFPSVIIGHKRFYVETTLGRECEQFWADLWELGIEAIRSADNIVIIGYSMPIVDAAARELLLENSGKDANISLWCGTTSADLRNEFKTHGFTQVEVGPGGRFEHFLSS